MEKAGEVEGLGVVCPLGELYVCDGDPCEGQALDQLGLIELASGDTHRRGTPSVSGSTRSWATWARGTRE